MQDESLAERPRALHDDAAALPESPSDRVRARGDRPGAPASSFPRVHTRVRHGIRRPHNWMQLVKFCIVGGSGFLVNLTVFALASEALGLHHLESAAVAYVVAVTNNFLWNRYWTFRAQDGRAAFQAARFFAVSTSAALLAAAILEVLVSAVGVAELPAQAISIVMATPLNFVGNKMWSFGRSPRLA
jgi:dolichol-phosphate mannosyltransferase